MIRQNDTYFLNNDCSIQITYFRKRAEEISKTSSIDADHYHYFSQDKIKGICGIARTVSWIGGKAKGSVCFPQKQYRTAISEWVDNAAKTALVNEFIHFLRIHKYQNK